MADIFTLVSMEMLLPFMLVLAITYGALEVSKVFGNRAVKAIIAVVFAFFAIMNYQVVAFINSILPYAAVFFVVLFLVWIVLKPIIGGKKEGEKRDPVIVVVVLVLVLIILARLQATGNLPSYGFFTSENLVWIIGLAILAFVVYKAYKIGV